MAVSAMSLYLCSFESVRRPVSAGFTQGLASSGASTAAFEHPTPKAMVHRARSWSVDMGRKLCERTCSIKRMRRAGSRRMRYGPQCSLRRITGMQQPTTVAAWTLRSAEIDGYGRRCSLVAVLHFRDNDHIAIICTVTWSLRRLCPRDWRVKHHLEKPIGHVRGG